MSWVWDLSRDPFDAVHLAKVGQSVGQSGLVFIVCYQCFRLDSPFAWLIVIVLKSLNSINIALFCPKQICSVIGRSTGLERIGMTSRWGPVRTSEDESRVTTEHIIDASDRLQSISTIAHYQRQTVGPHWCRLPLCGTTSLRITCALRHSENSCQICLINGWSLTFDPCMTWPHERHRFRALPRIPNARHPKHPWLYRTLITHSVSLVWDESRDITTGRFAV